MSSAVEVRGVSYRYPESADYALRGLDFQVAEGEFVLVSGPSGSGKSTLCRLLNGLIPYYWGGELEGDVVVDGLAAAGHGVGELSSHVGLVFQDPESQILMESVENEIAFGLENMRLGASQMGERIRWAAHRLGIGSLLTRSTSELSGGEKQKVVLASVLAMRPRILVLDEPTSQLDRKTRGELYDTLKSLNKDGITVIVVEHNVADAAPYVDRTFELAPGLKSAKKPHEPAPAVIPGEAILQVEGLSGGWGARKVIENLSLTVRRGECVAITGRNGAGKTTLVRHFNGLMKPWAGTVRVCGQDTAKTPTEILARKVAYLPQNPADMLFLDSAQEELEFTLRHVGVRGDVEGMLKRFDLVGHRGSYPRDLSVGERQRLAIAAVLVADPCLVVLDEPTRGIDATARATLLAEIARMRGEGRAVVLVTQDEGLVRESGAREMRLGASDEG